MRPTTTRTTTLTRCSRLTRLALLCAGLAACAPFVSRTTGPLAEADAAYALGRDRHLAGQPDAARAAYGAALQAAPGHPGARNGLATLHAESGELTPAIAIWRDLVTALVRDAAPDKAYLLVNLGHAHLLDGDHDQARAALERACLLDPLNPRAWQLLGETLGAQGQDERAQQMFRQAAALRQHDLRADFAAAGGQTAVASLGQAMGAPLPSAHPGWAQEQVEVGEDGMMALRRTVIGTGAGGSTHHDAPQPPALGRHVTQLEISNGNGVTGMARALSRRIDEPGMQVTRLSNQPGFAVRHTRIEYEAAYFDAARRLAQRLGSAQLQEVGRNAPTNLRLVLGRDLARHGTALHLGVSATESLSLR
ncbi:tetratricopeptide repeat protein [Massilia aurea]|uniref:tetratricopeptide repeat protein n=1 Tax=Massilia aurea TaxID=373040 RepID=UPI0034635D42